MSVKRRPGLTALRATVEEKCPESATQSAKTTLVATVGQSGRFASSAQITDTENNEEPKLVAANTESPKWRQYAGNIINETSRVRFKVSRAPLKTARSSEFPAVSHQRLEHAIHDLVVPLIGVIKRNAKQNKQKTKKGRLRTAYISISIKPQRNIF